MAAIYMKVFSGWHSLRSNRTPLAAARERLYLPKKKIGEGA
jgi:hypothetical protein